MGLAQYYSLNDPDLTVDIDNEDSATSAVFALTPPVMNWTTATGAKMNWVTQTGAAMTWYAAGIAVTSPEAVAQNGVMLGMTASTNCDDMAIISLMIDNQITGYRG